MKAECRVRDWSPVTGLDWTVLLVKSGRGRWWWWGGGSSGPRRRPGEACPDPTHMSTFRRRPCSSSIASADLPDVPGRRVPLRPDSVRLSFRPFRSIELPGPAGAGQGGGGAGLSVQAVPARCGAGRRAPRPADLLRPQTSGLRRSRAVPAAHGPLSRDRRRQYRFVQGRSISC